ncbi:uncharacterized protein METZ01_LOCUS308008, partial [marine metagenome]
VFVSYEVVKETSHCCRVVDYAKAG